jgi:hypothetical protein
MIVAELIEFLKTQDQTLPVAYRCCSEQCLMEANDIMVLELCLSRPDGHVQNYRKDKLTTKYLVFPGN